MRAVSISEANTSLSALLPAVAAGEEIIITKRNKPVARLMPFEEPKARPSFGMAKGALQRSGLDHADIAQALELMTEDELEAWGIA